MEAESGKVIADMSGENRRQIVLKGGKGGNLETSIMQPLPCRFRNMHSQDSLHRNWKYIWN